MNQNCNPHNTTLEHNHKLINNTSKKLNFHTQKKSSQFCIHSIILLYIIINMETVTSMVGEKPVVIFSKSTCCLSHSVTSLIRSFGANPIVYELDKITNGSQIENELIQMGCKPSVPAVFIGQQFRGGSKKIMSLHVRNQLVPMLKDAGAIWI